MSWDAYLSCDACGHEVGEWNYTYNTSPMISMALRDQGVDLGEARSMWDWMKDRPGPEGAAMIAKVVAGLEADPDKFRAMNPENGWGDYDGLLKVLREMCASVPECRTTWRFWL